MHRKQVWLGLFTFVSLAGASSAQTDVAGKTKVPIGNGVPGISFLGKNKTKRDIHDFTFLLGADCGVTIQAITVTGPGGLGDWDVDDNEGGASQGPGETDDTDGSAGTKARVDNDGAGGEPAPQAGAGKEIKADGTFTIDITFSGMTTGPCTLCITPTNDKGFQLCTASLPGGLMAGANVFTVDNDVMVTHGAGAGFDNNTGNTITGLQFARPSGLPFGAVFEVDPDSSIDLASNGCGAPACGLILAAPVPPGGVVSFDAALPLLDPGSGTAISITPLFGSSPGAPFCFGDGSLPTPCPCVPPNVVPVPSGAPGRGCANSFDLDGARLVASGFLSPDTLRFVCAVGPSYSGFGFLVKGNLPSALGIANADGVRCVSGALVRFGGHNAGTNGAALGAWSYPNTAQTISVSVATGQPPGQSAFYQLIYRNTAPLFCTSGTTNWSSGLRVDWP